MEHLQIENKAARLKLNESVHKGSIDRLVEEIEQVFGAKAAEAGIVTGEITNCIENAADTLEIEINSGGGSVLDGYVLYNSILDMRERGVEVTANVSLAASMASVIAMAADRIVMREGGRMMIHEASAGTQGDAAEHRNRAELLEGISDEIASIYADRTGIEAEKVRAMMKKETWMDASEAVRLGFADAKFDRKPKTKAMSILDRLSKPSDSEAQEKLVALQNEIDTHSETITELQAKVDEAEDAMQGVSAEMVCLKESKEAAEAKAVELEAKVSEFEAAVKAADEAKAELEKAHAEEVEALKAESEESKAKVDARASELLAEQGHAAPVSLEDDGQVSKSHSEIFETLTGSEATAYYKEHGKQIRAELRARK